MIRLIAAGDITPSLCVGTELQRHALSPDAAHIVEVDGDVLRIYDGDPDNNAPQLGGDYDLPGAGLSAAEAVWYVRGSQTAIASLVDRWEATLEPAGPTWLVAGYSADGTVYKQWRIVAGAVPGLPVVVT